MVAILQIYGGLLRSASPISHIVDCTGSRAVLKRHWAITETLAAVKNDRARCPLGSSVPPCVAVLYPRCINFVTFDKKKCYHLEHPMPSHWDGYSRACSFADARWSGSKKKCEDYC